MEPQVQTYRKFEERKPCQSRRPESDAGKKRTANHQGQGMEGGKEEADNDGGKKNDKERSERENGEGERETMLVGGSGQECRRARAGGRAAGGCSFDFQANICRRRRQRRSLIPSSVLASAPARPRPSEASPAVYASNARAPTFPAFTVPKLQLILSGARKRQPRPPRIVPCWKERKDGQSRAPRRVSPMRSNFPPWKRSHVGRKARRGVSG